MLAELVQRGHRVSCFVTERFAGLVREAGVDAVVYDSRFPWFDGPSGSLLENMLEFFEESFAPMAEAVSHFTGDRPDLIAHDSTASETGRLLARAWDLPVVQLCPTMASSSKFSMGERQSQEASGPPPEPIDPQDPKITRFLERRGRLLAESGLDKVSVDGFGAEEGDNIVFVPKAFQIAPETFDDRFSFIGPCLTDEREEPDGPQQPSDTSAGVWRPPEDGSQVLLLSLGSSHTPDQAAFLRSCIEALADSPWHVVATLGHRIQLDELGPLPGNVEVHQWLRHPEVLRHASAFITHAGMGSLMEALFFGVPVVLVPYQIDQRVIAAQAADLDLGRVLHREATTPAALRAMVHEVTTSPRIHAAVDGMRRHVREAGGATRGADVIESLMRHGPTSH